MILVNDDTPGLTWSNPQSGHYTAQEVINSPVGPLSFDRGWASIDARLKQQPFRFVTTHLETEDFPAVQQAQATEFLKGPGQGRDDHRHRRLQLRVGRLHDQLVRAAHRARQIP